MSNYQYHGQGGYTVQPPEIITTYMAWRMALHLSERQFAIPLLNRCETAKYISNITAHFTL